LDPAFALISFLLCRLEVLKTERILKRRRDQLETWVKANILEGHPIPLKIAIPSTAQRDSANTKPNISTSDPYAKLAQKSPSNAFPALDSWHSTESATDFAFNSV